MAPYDNPPSATLTTKISPLIDGQLPDFVRDENPLFSKLLQYYYEYLEAAELLVDAQVDNILQETVDVQYILDEDGNNISLVKDRKFNNTSFSFGLRKEIKQFELNVLIILEI